MAAKQKVTPFMQSSDNSKHLFFRGCVVKRRWREFMGGVGNDEGGVRIRLLEQDSACGIGRGISLNEE